MTVTTQIKEPLFSPSTQYTDANPGYVTEWEDKSCCCKCCCCCQIAHFPVGDFTVCGHWKTSFPKVLFVSILFIASFIVFLYNLIIDPTNWLLNRKPLLYAITAVTIFAFLCLMVSYFNTICKGPGYYPYTWCQSKKQHYTWEEMMSGVAVYQEQVEWARANERPVRSSFSVNARRFVMRADHFCAWAQSWIGAMNHKDFILTTFWAAVYLLLFIVSQIPALIFGFYEMIHKELVVLHLIMTIILVLADCVAIYLFFFSSKHFCVAMRNLSHNETITERYKNRPRVYSKKGCLNNFAEICGPKWCCCLWPFPFFPCIKATKTTWSDDENSQDQRDPLNEFPNPSVLK